MISRTIQLSEIMIIQIQPTKNITVTEACDLQNEEPNLLCSGAQKLFRFMYAHKKGDNIFTTTTDTKSSVYYSHQWTLTRWVSKSTRDGNRTHAPPMTNVCLQTQQNTHLRFEAIFQFCFLQHKFRNFNYFIHYQVQRNILCGSIRHNIYYNQDSASEPWL